MFVRHGVSPAGAPPSKAGGTLKLGPSKPRPPSTVNPANVPVTGVVPAPTQRTTTRVRQVDRHERVAQSACRSQGRPTCVSPGFSQVFELDRGIVAAADAVFAAAGAQRRWIVADSDPVRLGRYAHQPWRAMGQRAAAAHVALPRGKQGRCGAEGKPVLCAALRSIARLVPTDSGISHTPKSSGAGTSAMRSGASSANRSLICGGGRAG